MLALILVSTSATLLARSAAEARRSVRHIQVSVEVPLGYLGDALESDTAGEALLQRATASTGARRGQLLAQSIASGESATKSWTSYRANALHLPGEAQLAANYERDYAAGKAVAASVLVPIIRSSAPTPLPDAQVVAAELDRRDLIALQGIYEGEDHAALRSLDQQNVNERNAVLIGAAALGVIMLAGFALALRTARRTVSQGRKYAMLAELADFEGRLTRALEFADSDDDAFRVASRAFTETLPDTPVSIVVADARQETFTPIVTRPSCGVESVQQCRASRAGVPLQFGNSESLDTCPVLSSGAKTPCSVTCVPVSVAGIQTAVVQLTGPVGTPPDMGSAVPLIVRRLGDRITTMRALARFQLQASHDPLTGLLNRRSLEEAVDRLIADATPYAVAFADLDHFKLLNDVHGHDAGDRALQAFAATLKTSLRPDDLVGRWGGEEFVVVFPNCEQQQAIDAMDRMRAQLALEPLEARGGSNVAVSVTVSVGVAMRGPDEPFDHAVARADQALNLAKAAGRDRVEAWRPSLNAPAEAGAETDACLPLVEAHQGSRGRTVQNPRD